jgi:DNA-3-methyladenine glycosylase
VTSVLPTAFFDRDPVLVAPDLLGKVLVRGGLAGRIVEVEAYRGELDPASHAFGGLRPRCATMFGPPGRLYVYFTYGMHFCANVVCLGGGMAGAVLLRALSPLAGVDEMRTAREAARSRNVRSPRSGVNRRDRPALLKQGLRDVDLLAGPARLCQAFGIDGNFDGIDVTDPASALVVVDDGTAPPQRPGIGPRIGLGARTGVAVQLPWRFWVLGDPNVSAGRRGRGDVAGPLDSSGASRLGRAASTR